MKPARASRGACLVLAIPIVLMTFLLSIFLLDFARAQYAAEKAERVAEAATLSALRLRVDAIQKIAERWQTFGQMFLSGDASGAFYAGSRADLERKAAELKGALGGYKGRVKAVTTVVAEANGISRERLVFLENNGFELGVGPMSQWAVQSDGSGSLVQGMWYRRETFFEERGSLRVKLPLALAGATLFDDVPAQWSISGAAAGGLAVDMRSDDSHLSAQANGGYPATWTEALLDGRVVPHRYPYFREQLTRRHPWIPDRGIRE